MWELPEGGLKDNMDEPVVNLVGHQRRVGIVEWHPTAENLLFSAGFDYMVRQPLATKQTIEREKGGGKVLFEP